MHPSSAQAGRALVGLVLMLGLWEATSRSGLVASAYLPPPMLVATRMTQLPTDPQFLAAAVSTLLSWAIALGCATAVGVLLGLLVGSVTALWVMITPLVETLRPLPSVALIPLVVVVSGGGAHVKIIVAALAASWPILLNTVHALRTIDPLQGDTARVFRVSCVHMLLGLTLPAVAPTVLTGIRLSASIVLIVLVGAEFLVGGTIGLGQFAYLQGSAAGRLDLVLATMAFAALANCAVDAALLVLQARVMPWLAWTKSP